MVVVRDTIMDIHKKVLQSELHYPKKRINRLTKYYDILLDMIKQPEIIKCYLDNLCIWQIVHSKQRNKYVKVAHSYRKEDDKQSGEWPVFSRL